MNTHRWVLALTIAVGTLAPTLGACLEAREGRMASGAAATAPPAPSCAITGLVVTERGAIGPVAPSEVFAPSFQLAGQRVVRTEAGTRGSNAPEDSEVVRIAPGSGAREQLTFNDVDDAVVSVDGDSLLLLRGEGTTARQLIVRDPAGETVIASELRLVLSGDEAERRWLSAADALATWVSCAGPEWSCATMHLSVAHAGQVDVLRTWTMPTRAQILYEPEIANGRVVWAERSDDSNARWSVIGWAPGEGEVVLVRDLAVSDRPRVSGDVLFAPTVAGLERITLPLDGTPGTRTVLAAGRCSIADTPRDGRDRALFSCLPAAPDTEPSWAPFMAGPLRYWDGATVHTLGVAGTARGGDSGGGSVASARIAGDFIVWIAYDAADAGCYAVDEVGRVMAASVDQPELVVRVAEVGVGCMCCGAYWPFPQLGLDEGLVVWNYAREDVSAAPSHDAPLGYARISAVRACGDR